jgi:catechol 2,3-dioxygenase-like lactoylglutathione lyase family enzyme
MYSSGNITVYVSDMDRSVRFYTEVLGLRLAYRFANAWASIEVGKGLTIGLHPANEHQPAGRKGSMAIGLELEGSMRDAIAKLEAKGVKFGHIDEGKGAVPARVAFRSARRSGALTPRNACAPAPPARPRGARQALDTASTTRS